MKWSYLEPLMIFILLPTHQLTGSYLTIKVTQITLKYANFNSVL